MVELKVDALDWEQYKGEHYVAVRIGEVQKISKITASKTYKFPASVLDTPNKLGNNVFGKVEVFRRVGSGNVAVADGQNEVTVHCGAETLRFDVGVALDSAAQEKKGAAPAEQPPSAKFAQAKAYLAQHQMEARLAEAMEAVLRQRPADPAAFVAERLVSNPKGIKALPVKASEPPPLAPPGPPPRPAARGEENTEEAAPAKSAPPPMAPVEAPVKAVASAPAESSVSPLLPFSAYYQQHALPSASASLQSLYGRFPAFAAAPKSDLPATAPADDVSGFHFAPSVGSWLQPLPPRTMRREACEGSAGVGTDGKIGRHFGFSPSVGTWLQLQLPSEPFESTESADGAAGLGFAAKPSVGAWLQLLPSPLRRPAVPDLS
mmetsp:Transcript_30151/g.64185  ORF Transcript_30151/g.64185 Transcript_30151/m.64185 type:complete len:377 (-) Transcript_30151:74-1204(-)